MPWTSQGNYDMQRLKWSLPLFNKDLPILYWYVNHIVELAHCRINLLCCNQCMPIIVAAETSPDLILRNKAYYLHRYAHDKYGSILYTHFSDYLTAAFEYQKLHFGNHPKGKCPKKVTVCGEKFADSSVARLWTPRGRL